MAVKGNRRLRLCRCGHLYRNHVLERAKEGRSWRVISRRCRSMQCRCAWFDNRDPDGWTPHDKPPGPALAS